MAKPTKPLLKHITYCMVVITLSTLILIVFNTPVEAGRRLFQSGRVYSPTRKSLNLPYRKALSELSKKQMSMLKQGAALPGCNNGDEKEYFFKFEILTPSITASIRSPIGHYPVDQKLGVKVISSQVGWRMALHATAAVLKDGHSGKGKNSIIPGEICLSTGSGYSPLSRLVTVVSNGPPNENIMYFDLALVTNTLHQPGDYKGKLIIKVTPPRRSEDNEKGSVSVCDPVVFVPFEITVTSQFRHSVSGNKIYFHVGNPFRDRTLTGTIHGHIEADAPVSLKLEIDDGRVDRLPQIKSISLHSKNTESYIPLEWALSETGGSYRGPDFMNRNKREASWVIQSTPGVVDYNLDCTINPASYQEPGEYGTSVTMTIKPLL